MASGDVTWMIKTKLKNLILSLLKIIPKKFRKELAYFFAKSVGITEYSFSWKYGNISGSIGDQVVFRELFRSGSFSNDIIELFVNYHKASQFRTFLDVGGNIGLIAIPVAAETGATIHTFEPEPMNFRFLTANVASSGQGDRIRAYNCALFDKKTELEFELSHENHGDHRIRSLSDQVVPASLADQKEKQIIRINGDRLDNILPVSEVNLPMACKIDTQGAEPYVYAGGRSIFTKAGLLVIEFWPYGMKRMGGDVDGLISMLLEDFSKGGMRRDERSYHDPDFNGPSARLESKLRALCASGEMDDWCDLVLSN
jgi:FkbM family methyltransferase